MPTDPHSRSPLFQSGPPLASAQAALILVHGRGSDANDLSQLGAALLDEGTALLLPEAVGNVWYPQRFIAPIEANEPWLSSALATLARAVDSCVNAGISADRVAIGGFSQGACLSLEYAARNPRRYAAVLAFSGALIGPSSLVRQDSVGLNGTPVFLGCSDVDSHIPLERVEFSATHLATLGAEVHKSIYPGMGHQINGDEVRQAREILRSSRR